MYSKFVEICTKFVEICKKLVDINVENSRKMLEIEKQ